MKKFIIIGFVVALVVASVLLWQHSKHPSDAKLARQITPHYLFSMSTATAHLLEEFEQLSPGEQREFSRVILHRTVQLDYAAPTDEELTAAAASVFALRDKEEV